MAGLPRSLPLLRSTRPMSRDKADTLMLLAACTLVLAPHVGHLRTWVTGACVALLIWRAWVTFRGNRMPPRWLLLPLAVAATFAVYRSYGTLLGREAGVTMLVLLLAFKLLEMRARRDLFVVVFLSFFVLLTNFFYSQSVGMAVLMVAAVILILTAQLSFQYTGAAPPLGRRLRLGATIFVLAAPLTLLLFMLFPRIQGPLWGMPGDAQGGKTGLSDTMSPGDITSLALSGDIAFRVRFLDELPPRSRLYWRGPVLGSFNGRTWTQYVTPGDAKYSVNLLHRGAAHRYQVTLEPSGRNSVFALELPSEPPKIADNPIRATPDFQLLSRMPITRRVRYESVSHTDYQYDVQATPDYLRQWLRLPRGYNPATLAFAEKLRAANPSDDDAIAAMLRHFREQPYRYTLEPLPLGQNSMDDFLFGTRAGFCEHYASAFVVVMRAMGIPARVVTGYQGGEMNGVDGFMTIRQSDAHAWAEVWLDKRGWVRVDPTAAVAPNRIQLDLTRAVPTRILGGLMTFDTGQDSLLGRLRALRQNWDAFNNAWNQWVLDYTPDRQRSLLESMGLKNVDWGTMAALMFGLGALVVMATAIPLTRNRPRVDPIEALYQALCRQMAAAGLPREIHEGPRDYGARLAAAPLPPQKKAAIARFLQYYEALRYAPAPGGKPSAPALSHLRSLLAACR
jgi:transglutaminase-like putative cysteine protease